MARKLIRRGGRFGRRRIGWSAHTLGSVGVAPGSFPTFVLNLSRERHRCQVSYNRERVGWSGKIIDLLEEVSEVIKRFEDIKLGFGRGRTKFIETFVHYRPDVG